jgi:hypothetical protein
MARQACFTRRDSIDLIGQSCIKDVLSRLPTQAAGQIEELLPHRWQPSLGY